MPFGKWSPFQGKQTWQREIMSSENVHIVELAGTLILGFLFVKSLPVMVYKHVTQSHCCGTIVNYQLWWILHCICPQSKTEQWGAQCCLIHVSPLRLETALGFPIELLKMLLETALQSDTLCSLLLPVYLPPQEQPRISVPPCSLQLPPARVSMCLQKSTIRNNHPLQVMVASGGGALGR